ncbi:hypothetical protein ACM93F_004151 [Enterobacter ludwigii]|jgi:hypothetical protein
MWGAIIGAGVSAAGSLLSSHMNNRNSQKLAANAVQTRVRDMRAAGLNPVLAAGQTGAAAVPQMQQPDFSSASQIYAQRTARKAQENQEMNQTRQTDSNIMLQSQQALSSAADVRVKDAQAKNLEVQNNLINEQVLTEAARRANLAAGTGLASAQQVRTQYQAMSDKVIGEFLTSPEGQRIYRTNQATKHGFSNPGTWFNLGGNAANSAADVLYNYAPDSKGTGTRTIGPFRITPRQKQK